MDGLVWFRPFVRGGGAKSRGGLKLYLNAFILEMNMKIYRRIKIYWTEKS